MGKYRESLGRAAGVLSAWLEAILASRLFFWSEVVSLVSFVGVALYGWLYDTFTTGQWAYALGVAAFGYGVCLLGERRLKGELKEASELSERWYQRWSEETTVARLSRAHADNLSQQKEGLRSVIHSLHWELERLRGVWLTSVERGQAFVFHELEKIPVGFSDDLGSWSGQWELDGVSEDGKTAWVKSISSGMENGMRIRATTRVVRVNEPPFYMDSNSRQLRSVS